VSCRGFGVGSAPSTKLRKSPGVIKERLLACRHGFSPSRARRYFWSRLPGLSGIVNSIAALARSEVTIFLSCPETPFSPSARANSDFESGPRLRAARMRSSRDTDSGRDSGRDSGCGPGATACRHRHPERDHRRSGDLRELRRRHLGGQARLGNAVRAAAPFLDELCSRSPRNAASIARRTITRRARMYRRVQAGSPTMPRARGDRGDARRAIAPTHARRAGLTRCRMTGRSVDS
jgi:hypothetical protein